MRFHIPAIPHTVTNQHYLSCAYTQKVFKLCAMLTELGHQVYHYGCEGSNPVCTENVTVISEKLRYKYYSTDFHTKQFKFDTSDEFHQQFYTNCITEIKKRQKPRDFLLCAWGWGHKPIADPFQSDMLIVESGIGYEDIFANFRVFESYTWMAHVYGLKNIKNGQAYDAVIPNFFDPEDFEFSDQKEDWFLYLGRIVRRKGVEVAVQVTQEIGAKLVIAGQGTLINEAEGININAPHVQHVGFADLKKRKELLSKAKAVFMPTYYMEPFGGVSIEAAMSGTPVISSDWGVFGENILHGITGYRCRTFDHYCWAAKNIHNISPKACREWAKANFTTNRVALMYQEYFEMLYDLWGEGWYTGHPKRKQLNWLVKSYSGLSTPFSSSEASTVSQPINGSAILTPDTQRKIAVWSDWEWAFGQITKNLQKIFCKEYDFQLFSWNKSYQLDTFDQFSLIYVPTWATRLDFLNLYPSIPPEKVICGIHGMAELFNHQYEPLQGGKYRVEIQAATLDAFKVPKDLIQHLSTIPAIGVVNKILYQRLKDTTGLKNLLLTECGVNTDEFEPIPILKSTLNVLYPLPIPTHFNNTHGYDAKRFGLLKRIQDNIEKDVPGIQFIIPENVLQNSKMAKRYPLGDVHICISHSEGGPLVAIESAACGLVQVATPVGIIPDIVDNGLSGFILNGKTEDEIYEELCNVLNILNKDRGLLDKMKTKTRKIIENEWTWEHKKTQWKSLFECGLTQKGAPFSNSNITLECNL